jgi:uncharacterized glyoxalase superfamily protein PhnB
MQMRNLAVCLTVDDVPAVADFYIRHFGFRATVSVESFAKLAHNSLDTELCLMQSGSEVLPADARQRRADGVILAFVVQDARAEEARLRAAGVAISMPLRDEEWGERLFQVQDPHGTPVELVEWLTSNPA